MLNSVRFRSKWGTRSQAVLVDERTTAQDQRQSAGEMSWTGSQKLTNTSVWNILSLRKLLHIPGPWKSISWFISWGIFSAVALVLERERGCAKKLSLSLSIKILLWMNSVSVRKLCGCGNNNVIRRKGFIINNLKSGLLPANLNENLNFRKLFHG